MISFQAGRHGVPALKNVTLASVKEPVPSLPIRAGVVTAHTISQKRDPVEQPMEGVTTIVIMGYALVIQAILNQVQTNSVNSYLQG